MRARLDRKTVKGLKMAATMLHNLEEANEFRLLVQFL
jgi:hypothetical protein